MDDYNEYARVFNTGNDALLLDKFFSFPFTFSTPFMNQTYKTRDEFLEALNFYHRVRECLDPQLVFYSDRKVFVDLEVVFHSSVEWLEFPYGPIRPGDMLQSRAFVVYSLDEKKRIVHAEEMFWPANYLNKPVSRLGASDTQRAALDAMIAGFNAGRFDVVGEFYTEDAVVEFPNDTQVLGRTQIVATYKELAKSAKVTLQLNSAICDDNGLFLELDESFLGHTDLPDFFGISLKAGETLRRQISVICRLKTGLVASSLSILSK